MQPFLVDGFVILLYFVLVIGIGLYKGRGSKDMDSFAIGDRNIPWWAVLASIIAAETSAGTFLGAPGEGYTHRNFTYAQLAIGTIIARIIIGYLFIKPFYDYRVVSIYEFLNIRFGVRTKNAASAVFLVTRALASGTRLYVGAIILVLGYEMISGEALTLMQELWIYVLALTFITAATAVYTTLGGIKAVVWTDVIQATVMFGGLGFAIWSLHGHLPEGISGALSKLTAPKDLAFFDTGINTNLSFAGNLRSILETQYTIWAALFGATFLTMATHGTDQDMVQRMLTAKDYKKSRFAVILSGITDLPLVGAFLLIGILLWCFYGDPDKQNSFAYYILHEMPSGVRGLLVAGVFATAMGSLSTALNALATSFTEDFYTPYINPKASPAQVVRSARITTVVFSVLLIIIGALTAYAALVLKSDIIPIILGIFGYTYGSLLGIFLVGMLTRHRGSEVGNLIAMLVGFLVTSLFSGLHNAIWQLIHGDPKAILWAPDWLPTVAFVWRVMIGTIATVLVALLFRTPQTQIDSAERLRARAGEEPLGGEA